MDSPKECWKARSYSYSYSYSYSLLLLLVLFLILLFIFLLCASRLSTFSYVRAACQPANRRLTGHYRKLSLEPGKVPLLTSRT